LLRTLRLKHLKARHVGKGFAQHLYIHRYPKTQLENVRPQQQRAESLLEKLFCIIAVVLDPRTQIYDDSKVPRGNLQDAHTLLFSALRQHLSRHPFCIHA